MSQDKWEDTKHEILKKYYLFLYKESPTDTRKKEYLHGNIARGGVLRRIDV
jgi:hypothetical protein